MERVGGGNQGTPLSKTVPFFQNTNTSLKIPLPLTIGNIIKTICYVTNTHPSCNDHTTLFHIITIPHGMVTRNSHYLNLALDTRSHCGPIFLTYLQNINANEPFVRQEVQGTCLVTMATKMVSLPFRPFSSLYTAS